MDSNQYILGEIKNMVWSGFSAPDEVQQMIGEILEEDADEDMLRESVAEELAAKAAAEDSWPSETDCDRLDSVFAELNHDGIIALANVGATMSDGLSEVDDAVERRGRDTVRGYCFYHGQDVARAVNGGGLFIAFGDLDNAKVKKAEIGSIVRNALEREGFHVEWNGNSESRLKIPAFDWKRRSNP